MEAKKKPEEKPAAAPVTQYDLMVYGATAGGVITAVAAAREGLKVVLVEPGRHLGGMMTSGISRTDYGAKEVIGGMAVEFFWRLGNHYEMRRYGQDAAWYFEPHVAELVMKEMIEDAKVTILFDHRLREKTGVKKEKEKIVEITMENGAVIQGQLFADATYEGDLMAQSGVSYAIGREGIKQYNEPLAGVRDSTPCHQFTVDISPFDEKGKLLPEISPDPPGEVGSGDKKIPAYTFFLCLTVDKSNQIPFPKPKGYDPHRYDLFLRMLNEMNNREKQPQHLEEVTLPAVIPNKKAVFNNWGGFSLDVIGKNWDYPEANYKAREKIWQDHYDYVAGFFYFLANDPHVDKALREEINAWGLSKDEFLDTDHWPHQLYVREARRMIGEYVMTQKDLKEEPDKPDPIGMGSYNIDSHNVQRVVTKNNFVVNEGDIQVSTLPYQIPYRILLPKKSECQNLLVPVCVSSSHIAYSSLRMEPQYMILGHAAGIAAKFALETGKPLHEIDTKALTKKLVDQGMVMKFQHAIPRPIYKGFKQTIIN